MRWWPWIFLVGCGGGAQTPDAAPPIDSAGPDSAVLDAAIDAAIDTQPIDAPPPCTLYGGVWRNNGATFAAEVAPVAVIDFETRADGVTPVTAGVPVPVDEYLACCGVRLEAIGVGSPRLLWAGNAVGGFSVRALCGVGICPGVVGIRIDFEPPVSAVGVDYSGGTNAAMFAPAGGQVSTMSVTGSGSNFLGYEAAVLLGRAEYVDDGVEDVRKLFYHRCP